MIQPDTRVRILSGPQQGMEGLVKNVDGDDVIVEVSIWGRAREERVPAAQLELLQDPASAARELLEHRAALALEAHALHWWAHEAPPDPAEAAAACPAARERWEAAVAQGRAQAEAWLAEHGPELEGLKTELRAALPCPPLTEAESKARAQGRVTAGGAPRLSEAERAQQAAVRSRAEALRAAALGGAS